MRLVRSIFWARATGSSTESVFDGFGAYPILFILGLTALCASLLAGVRTLMTEGGRREFYADPLAQASRLAEQGLLDRAVGQCRMAAIIDPSAPTTWYLLGEFLRRSGRYEDAEQALQRAVRINPGPAETWIALGDVALDRHWPAVAAERYSQALARDPRSATAHNGLGIAFVSLGRMDEAINHFAAAAEASGDPAIRANLERARTESARATAGPLSNHRP